jgi:hypothetical protein
MADTASEGPPVPTVRTGGGDPARPRFLGLWVAGILLIALFGGASSVIVDVFYRLFTGK